MDFMNRNINSKIRKITALVLTAALLPSATFAAEVTRHSDTGNTVIKGTAEENAIIGAVKDGRLVFIDEKEVDENGNYFIKTSVDSDARIVVSEDKNEGHSPDVTTVNGITMQLGVRYENGCIVMNINNVYDNTISENRLITGVYDDFGSLVDVKVFDDILIKYNEFDKELSFEYKMPDNASRVKIFLWKNSTNGVPLAEVASGVFDSESGMIIPEGSILDVYSDEDIENAATRLMNMMDVHDSATEAYAELYESGRYEEALILYRNHFVDIIRSLPAKDIGFGESDTKEWADIVVGRLSVEEFNESVADSKTISQVQDTGNFTNPEYLDPDVISNFDWFTSADEGYNSLNWRVGRETYNCLARTFAASGDELYLKKCIQVLDDMSRNQRVQWDSDPGFVEALERSQAEDADWRDKQAVITYLRNAPNSNGYWYLGGNLTSGNCVYIYQRARGIMNCLATICKSLPNTYEEQYYSGYYAKVNNNVQLLKIPEESYDLIDPVRLSNIICNLVNNEFWRTTYFLTDNAQPGYQNMVIGGLSCLGMYMYMLRDFSSVTEKAGAFAGKVNERMDVFVQPDGGFLEQAFNYNEEDIAMLTNLSEIDFSVVSGLDDLTDFNRIKQYWNRLKEGYTSPLGLLSNIGNEYNVGTPAIWEDDNKKESFSDALDIKEQAYTSVYYPYSGYGAMRSGWNIDSLYMSFFNNNRRAQGHHLTGTNAVMNLSAYGRTMLVSGGAPYYGKSYVSNNDEFLEIYDELNSYFLENSTRKLSTVIVNDKSQNYKNYTFNEDGSVKDTDNDGDLSDEGTRLDRVSETVLPERWYSSEKFDFAEGVWDSGYNEIYDREASLVQKSESDTGAVSLDAIHDRDMIFVKKANLWIVLDKLKNMSESQNKYTSIWNFAGYEEGSNVLTGYKEEQIVIDDADNTVYTADAGNPNLFIKAFSDTELSFNKYFGYYEPGKIGSGWTNRGISEATGNYAPSADVHMSWTDDSDISQVAYVLAPSADEISPIFSSEDLSADGVIGFKLETANGVKVSCQSADTEQMLSVNGIELEGELLIVTEKDGILGGILISDMGSYEFKLENGAVVKISDITAPSGFLWQENGSGYMPLYNAE